MAQDHTKGHHNTTTENYCSQQFSIKCSPKDIVTLVDNTLLTLKVKGSNEMS